MPGSRRAMPPRPQSTPSHVPVPRRSATSPSEWDRWNSDEDDLPIIPARSSRLVDSVPPPLPALPKRSGATPVSQVSASGRRYALSDLPADYVTAEPRRSATSPSQWRMWEGEDDHAPASYRSHSAARAETTPAAEQAEEGRRRRWPWWVWLLIALVTIGLVIGGFFLGSSLSERQANAAGPVDAAMLATPDEARQIGGSWSDAGTDNPVRQTSPTATCLPAVSSLAKPDQSGLRRMTSAAGLDLMHAVHVFASEDRAKQGFDSLQTALGTCSTGPIVHLDGAWSLWGLSNQAILVQATEQEQKPLTHSVVLLRVGRAVNVLDLAVSGEAPQPTTLLALLRPIVAKQCAPLGGSCATESTPSQLILPASDQAGFLVPADLPRITPGVGRWSSTAVTQTISTAGSGCELMKMSEVPGATRAFQRTFALSGDPKASPRFGIDEVLLQFGSADDATKAGQLLTQNIARCGDQTQSGTIVSRDPISSQLGNGTPISGTSFLVQQKGGSASVPFEVAVLMVDRQVVYLLLTPTDDYTMAKADWLALVTRAGERGLQLPR